MEETVVDAAVSVQEEGVTEEDEEDFQEAVVEVSLTSPRSSDSQEIEVPDRGVPCFAYLRKSYETKSS